MPLDRERLLELLEWFKASTAREFAVQEGERFYRFVRAEAVVEAPELQSDSEAPSVLSTPGQNAMASPTVAPEKVVVSARVVGLFYRGKEPGGAPLVEVGSHVESGQQLGIIEVLRKPTAVSAPVAGEIVQIFHEDGQGVQYGDPLFVIRPD